MSSIPVYPYRLGRKPPSPDALARIPRFAASDLVAALPPPPAEIILTEDIADATYSGTLGNTTAGDCTIAGMLRLQQFWAAKAQGKPVAFTDDQAITIYSALSGYDPATGANDTGLVETDVLDAWVNTGFEGNKLAGYSSIASVGVSQTQQAISIYGGVYLGLVLPESAMKQTEAGEPWSDVWYFSRALGGHCVVAFEYDQYYIYVGTWGKRQPVTWEFFSRHFDAAYAPCDPLWVSPGGQTPYGSTLDAMMADLPAVAT
jgi:hypothetical protein